MRTTTTHSLQSLFLIFLFPLALLTVPALAQAHHEHLAQATFPPEKSQVAEAPKSEGSKSKGYSHGSPQGMKKSPHGKSPHGKAEGSGSKHGYSKGYSHGSKHSYGKKEGSHGKRGYGKYGYGGGHRRGHGSHRGHGKDPFRHVLKFSGALGLTDAQISKVKDLKFEFAKERIMLKAQHEIAHMELDKMVHSGEVKEAEMRAIADQISEIKSKKIHGMVDAKIGLLKLLTAEQRKKISQLHSQH